MQDKFIRIYKNLGETPLEALERVRFSNPEYAVSPMTYAGRLDPMAEGELLILIGEECKNKEKYLNMDKEYEFEMLFGFKTDTYDLLGISTSREVQKTEIEEKIKKDIENYHGKIIQKYPPYSSKTLGGVPLFQKTKNGEVFDLPERQVEIFESEFLGLREISGEELLGEIKNRVGLVKGDFRQEEIINAWQKNLENKQNEIFTLGKARIVCSSGTYVRSLVHELSLPATTFSIKRVRVFDKDL